MPAAVIPIGSPAHGLRPTAPAEYVLLSAAVPGRSIEPIGVLLADPASDRGWLRLRTDFPALTDDTDFFDGLEFHLRTLLAESGAEALLRRLEDSLSNVLLVSERRAVAVDSFRRVLERLYAEEVEPVAIRPFETHVPLFSLRAAAGRLGEEMEVEPEAWIPAPEGMHLAPDLFAAHVVGKSMEPRIPDGSLNLFRLHPAGSRQGKILLIQRFGVLDETARFTVKRYTSRKRATGGGEFDDGQWEHERIRLEPLNPDFEPWDVEPQDFAVVAEWLRVLE
ncbi:MAG TPA: S24 family peptidase [Bryobacteraceae bacterium]|nr:S24 family peptidase [Bryobacteraceae bacterium]